MAERAGVSIVTVSRAMNAPHSVSPRTHARIEDAMRTLNYVPDLVARSMAQRRTGMVAAFVPSLLDGMFVEGVQGLGEVLAESDIHLVLGHTKYTLETEEVLVAATLGRRPDALVLTGTNHSARLVGLVRQAAVPVVETWGLVDDPIDMLVGYSHRAAGRALTEHLVARGRRRIGYFGRPIDDGNERAVAKHQGYLDAMAAADLEAPADWTLGVQTRMSAGERALDELVLRHRLDAVVFSGDDTAAGALLSCLKRGIKVPDDVALCGFGDQELARLVPGGLTTVRIDALGIGRRAGRMLLGALAGRESAERIVDIGFELIVRGST